MEISNEASIDPFSIGPTSIIGRAAVLNVLFCKSMTHLKHKVLYVVFYYWYKIKESLRIQLMSFISSFHPRNPHVILLFFALIGFTLRRHLIMGTCSVKFWKNKKKAALNYEQWHHAAKMLERETPDNRGDLYDVELVRNKLQELRHRRQEGSLRDIVFCMRADLIRNLGNMCNPELHMGRPHVPRLIKDYINEVSKQLRMVCDSDSEDLPLEEKFAFMHETRHAFGRTALLLSGGASLGTFHIGVVETLVEHKLLPRIIAGSSVGSIMASVLCTMSWPELQVYFYSSVKFFEEIDRMDDLFRRIMYQGAVHEIRQLQKMLRELTNNLTFQEAYDLTGRILGITVCSPRKHEPPRCLNYLTSPHVLIWSAVTASCAFPGLFEAQELMAKDRNGDIVPYHPPFHFGHQDDGGSPTSARRWRDGSLQADLPMMQLKELFNVNHFIVSQANPHIAPFLRLKEFVRSWGGNFAVKLANLAEMEIKHRCNQILELGFPLGKLFAQDWEGDVTIVMSATLNQYRKIIQNPSKKELRAAAEQGRKSTWEKLSAIKANCGIELALDECVGILNHMRRLRRSAERAAAAASNGLPSTSTSTGTRFNATKRIPSWNCMARELSTGSLEDEHVATTRRNWRNKQNSHDGSDSESETSSVHNSWTRSGGPLMRTISADKVVEYFENADFNVDTRYRSQIIRTETMNQISSTEDLPVPVLVPDSNSISRRNSDSAEFDQVISSSIMVAEGDFLQTEKHPNGILLNVVKKDALTTTTTTPHSNHTSPYTSTVAECFQLDIPGRDLDPGTTPEGSDNDERDREHEAAEGQQNQPGENGESHNSAS